MDEELFITARPKLNQLSKYISYYYFHSAPEKNEPKRIVYYPNTVNALTIYKDSVLDFNRNISIAHPEKKSGFRFYYGGIQKEYRIAEMRAPFEKTGIAFEPLGINAFISQPLSQLLSKNDNLDFGYFSELLSPIIEKAGHTQNSAEKVQLLDAFFLSQLNNFCEEQLEKALQLIQDSENKFTVNELAQTIGTSGKTLGRKFRKHLNCTVKDYIEVAQFRKSFNLFLNNGKKQTLTDLAYMSDYYDQAEFVKQFRKITGVNPKRVFKNIAQYGSEELFWNSDL